MPLIYTASVDDDDGDGGGGGAMVMIYFKLFWLHLGW